MPGLHDTQRRGSRTPVHVACDELPAHNPTVQWIGVEWEGALPIHTGEERFHPSVIDSGVGGIQHFFMCGEITCAEDLLDSVEGDEDTPIVIDTVIAMTGQAATVPAPMLMSPTFLHEMQRQSNACTGRMRKQESGSLLQVVNGSI